MGGVEESSIARKSCTMSAAAIPVISAVSEPPRSVLNMRKTVEGVTNRCRTQGRPQRCRRRCTGEIILSNRQIVGRGQVCTNTKFSPARPRIMRLTSRVVQPPASGVPVAGASPGSITSMSRLAEVNRQTSAPYTFAGSLTLLYLRYTGESPTRSRIRLMIAATP